MQINARKIYDEPDVLDGVLRNNLFVGVLLGEFLLQVCLCARGEARCGYAALHNRFIELRLPPPSSPPLDENGNENSVSTVAIVPAGIDRAIWRRGFHDDASFAAAVGRLFGYRGAQPCSPCCIAANRCSKKSVIFQQNFFQYLIN
jgi:hypothetical protein